MYVYIGVHMHIYIYIYVCVYIYSYTHIHIYMHIYIYMCVCVYKFGPGDSQIHILLINIDSLFPPLSLFLSLSLFFPNQQMRGLKSWIWVKGVCWLFISVCFKICIYFMYVCMCLFGQVVWPKRVHGYSGYSWVYFSTKVINDICWEPPLS